ncbi:hypothetical protein PCANC_24807 [Puccinia coronata f. sp. avenae]|uniref:Uncharacterized protein n=1 Tax=Puccinia coronata f. sp. avenae TaxID=200324 RepID=A0A2N5TQD2_9BASI|nr:hypothetical protein PCANC_24807 [Puccinia coronata f. sp. avenae]
MLFRIINYYYSQSLLRRNHPIYPAALLHPPTWLFGLKEAIRLKIGGLAGKLPISTRVNQYTKTLISTPEFVHPPFDQIAHFELIKHYLKVLRLRKEEEIANYQPSDWEKLTPTEQFQLALFHSHQRAQQDTELLIKLNSINRRNQENKRRADFQGTLEYKQNFYNMSSTISPSTSNTSTSSTTAPATSVANSITPLTAPPTILSGSLPGLTSLISTAPYPRPLDNLGAEKLPRNLAFKKTTPSLPNPQAMDVDVEPTPSTSLASIQKPQTEEEDLEIQVVSTSKEDKIAKLVKIHVANHQKFVEAQKSKATQEMMLNLLGLAQKSQKELQKLISKKEVEEYTKGWNPWEEKRVLFPHTANKNKGKNMSSLSMNNRHYNNPQKWKKLANISSAITSFYNSLD